MAYDQRQLRDRFVAFSRTPLGRVVLGAFAIGLVWAYMNRPIPELDEVCDQILWFDFIVMRTVDTTDKSALGALANSADNLRIRTEWNYYRIGERDAAAGRAVYRLSLASGNFYDAFESGNVDDIATSLFRFGVAMGRVESHCRWGSNYVTSEGQATRGLSIRRRPFSGWRSEDGMVALSAPAFMLWVMDSRRFTPWQT